MKNYNNQNALAQLGTAIGVGLISGFAGTVAMTLTQMAEMKVTGRKPSSTPVNAVREVLYVKPITESKSEEVSNEIHFTYGTSLGIIRGILGLVGLKGIVADSFHFLIVWGGQLFMLPTLRVAPPITHESPKTIATDVVHHLVYVATAGFVYDAIMCDKNNERNPEREQKDQ
jgi:hypothetical protein